MNDKIKIKIRNIKIKPKYLKEIKEKHTTYSLSKYLGMDQVIKIFDGKANITLKSYYKLCKAMGWDFPEHFEVELED